MADTCLETACSDLSCFECEYGRGPGTDGAYWPPELGGGDDWYWSSSSNADDPRYGTFIQFHDGYLSFYAKWVVVHVRCVRPGP